MKTKLLKINEKPNKREKIDSLCQLTLDYQLNVLKDKGDIILLPKELEKSFQRIQKVNLNDNVE